MVMSLLSPSSHSLVHCLGDHWQPGEWHELLGEGFGLGEFSVLMPLLAQTTARRARVALIHPPYQPYAPAISATGIDLNQLIVIEPKNTQAACWAAEHCLRALNGGVVIVWTQETQLLGDVALRRLRKAAQVGRSIGIALRPLRAQEQPSPAAVRLRYEAEEQGVRFTCFKRRLRNNKDAGQLMSVYVPHPTLERVFAPPTSAPLLYLHSALPVQ
jgi:cell division inhibitor SulA/protein ImuA